MVVDPQIPRRMHHSPEFRDKLDFCSCFSYMGKARTGQNRREATAHNMLKSLKFSLVIPKEGNLSKLCYLLRIHIVFQSLAQHNDLQIIEFNL